MLKAIHAQEDREVNFPYEHWTRLRTNNALERIMRDSNRSISGWLFRHDAGRSKTQTYFDNEMGNFPEFEYLQTL